MAIRLKYDVAGVVPPSDENTRKYGQNLVLQQKQLDNRNQQAGYDRLFEAQKQMSQQQFVAGRDQFQNDMAFRKENRDNKFLLEQQQQQQRTADFAAARSRIDTHARDMLSNGEIKDPSTRQKIQNLIAGKTIVMGSGFDETARQNYLDQYNAELAKILSEIPPPKSEPTRDEQLKSFLGDNYDQYKNQPWVPDGKGGFAVSKELMDAQKQQQQSELLKQQEQKKTMEQMRPQSAQDYYNDPVNKGQYDKDLDSAKKRLQEKNDSLAEGEKLDITDDAAWEEMQKRHDAKQKNLGRSQYGEPTPAPASPVPASPTPGMKSILAEDDGWADVGASQDAVQGGVQVAPAPGEPQWRLWQFKQPDVDPAAPAQTAPLSILGSDEDDEKIRQQWMDGAPQAEATPVAQPQSVLPAATPSAAPTQQQILDDKVSQLGPDARSEYDAMMRNRAKASAGGMPAAAPVDIGAAFGAVNQSEVAKTGEGEKMRGVKPSKGVPDINSAAPQAKTTPAKALPEVAQTQMPDPRMAATNRLFGLKQQPTQTPKSEKDLAFASTMQEMRQKQSPDVQSAIDVILSDGVSDSDFARAMMYLQQKGIDVEKLINNRAPVANGDPYSQFSSSISTL